MCADGRVVERCGGGDGVRRETVADLSRGAVVLCSPKRSCFSPCAPNAKCDDNHNQKKRKKGFGAIHARNSMRTVRQHENNNNNDNNNKKAELQWNLGIRGVSKRLGFHLFSFIFWRLWYAGHLLTGTLCNSLYRHVWVCKYSMSGM